MEILISKGEIGPLQGFRSKMGRLFNAIIKLTDTFEMKFEFGSNEMEEADAIDFSHQHPLGKCPKCSNPVYEHGLYYVCEKAVGATHTCDFKTGKIILNRAIEQEQIVKLLQTGKTNLLTKFISKKGRPFSAYLVIGKEGKIEFEFEQKASKEKIENTNEVKVSSSLSKKKRA